MRNYTIYETQTGRIKRIGCCTESDYILQAKSGESILDNRYNSEQYYISNNTPMLKTEFIDVTDRQTTVNTEITFSDLPNPTSVYIGNNVEIVIDGTFEVSFDFIGTYYLLFQSVTKITKGVKVEVSA